MNMFKPSYRANRDSNWKDIYRNEKGAKWTGRASTATTLFIVCGGFALAHVSLIALPFVWAASHFIKKSQAKSADNTYVQRYGVPADRTKAVSRPVEREQGIEQGFGLGRSVERGADLTGALDAELGAKPAAHGGLPAERPSAPQFMTEGSGSNLTGQGASRGGEGGFYR